LLDSYFLVKYEDIQTLANRIEELITNKELYERVSLGNFNNSQKYEATVLERKRDAFYQKLKQEKK
jgi:glycosyltransferase involved in cell wall biosynthesis